MEFFLFFNKSNAHANRLLAATIFTIATIMFLSFLLEWNIDYYAYIYRFPSPLYYLFLPTAYLYVRSVAKQETSFQRLDWLHFLPALLHLVEMMPFYLSSYEFRRAVTKQILENPQKLIETSEGLLPPYYHTVLRCVQGMFYVFLMIRVLRASKQVKADGIAIGKTETYRWLVTLTCILDVSLLIVPE